MSEQHQHYSAGLVDQGRSRVKSGRKPSYYHRAIHHVYRHLVPENRSVLEIGSGTGDLLAALRPSRGVGIEISPDMITEARRRHPDLEFVGADAHDATLNDETFDYIILSDVVLDLWDVQEVFANLRQFCHPATRVIINSYSRVWRGPLRLARTLRLAQPRFGRSWMDPNDIKNLLYLEGFETIRTTSEILWPVPTPLIARFVNRFLAKLAPFRWFDLTNIVIARPAPVPQTEERTVSVVVPARNEAGHIRDIIEAVPEIGAGTELIFIEGNSTDDTWDVIKNTVPEYPEKNIKIMQQPGKGKGDAVRAAFAESSGDILMIFDADLTVPSETLELFYDAIQSGRGEFANGVRLVYPMHDEAMRFLNLCGNKFFAMAFTWILGQPIKDTLCGTKVLTRESYDRIADNRAYFGEFDPFGDFDLIFGAAKQNMKIVDIPIRYQHRVYGDTNISRWSHGALLFRMMFLAARRLKFV